MIWLFCSSIKPPLCVNALFLIIFDHRSCFYFRNQDLAQINLLDLVVFQKEMTKPERTVVITCLVLTVICVSRLPTAKIAGSQREVTVGFDCALHYFCHSSHLQSVAARKLSPSVCFNILLQKKNVFVSVRNPTIIITS